MIARKTLDQEYQSELRKHRAERERERLQQQKKIKELERQVQRKTANQLGDEAEIDLLQTLQVEFHGDTVARIGKGRAGGDILHEFVTKGQTCGRVLIESKNCQTFQKAFCAKLKRDQSQAKADHALIATAAFPPGKKDLCVVDGVIIVAPSGVTAVIHLFRQASLRMHALGLSLNQRGDKMDKLYAYIISREFVQQFTEIGETSSSLSELDAQEQRQHERTWSRRSAVQAVKIRGYETPSALIRAAIRNEVTGRPELTETEERIAGGFERMSREIVRLARGQQALFALVDTLAKTLLTCLPEPPPDARPQAIARAKERYDRLMKTAGQSMSSGAHVPMQDLAGHGAN